MTIEPSRPPPLQEVAEAKKVMGPEALLREKIKQRRHREGYDEGISSSHKVASALAFVASEAPVEMLGQFTRLELDGAGSWQVWTVCVYGGEWAGRGVAGGRKAVLKFPSA